MRISRIFVPTDYEANSLLEVVGETSHYLKTVLRLKKGWKLILCNGQGHECLATVEGFGRDSSILRLETPALINRESPLEVRLALGISRGERMDLAIQKAVELGVSRITPLLTEFCVVRLDEEKKDLRLAHWQRVIRSAIEQCGRNWMPVIDPPSAYDHWLISRERVAHELLLDPSGQSNFAREVPFPRQITLLVGPEGGLSDPEKQRAMASGFEGIRLGPRILRTETAVITALAAVQTLWGDLGSPATNP